MVIPKCGEIAARDSHPSLSNRVSRAPFHAHRPRRKVFEETGSEGETGIEIESEIGTEAEIGSEGETGGPNRVHS
jgi:hypothetical protein